MSYQSISDFIRIRPAVLELKHANRRTDMTSPVCVHVMHIVQGTETHREDTSFQFI
jgi:hypothetical protein